MFNGWLASALRDDDSKVDGHSFIHSFTQHTLFSFSPITNSGQAFCMELAFKKKKCDHPLSH